MRSSGSSNPTDSQHAARHTGAFEVLVGIPDMRRQHRQADDALDAAETGGALITCSRSKTRHARP
jgi:hypothetical protein